LAQPGIQQQEAITAAQRRITQFNQQSQREARLALVRGEGRIEEANRLESAQFRGQLAGDLFSAIAGITEGVAVDVEAGKQIALLLDAKETSRANVLLGFLELNQGTEAEREAFLQELTDILKGAVGRNAERGTQLGLRQAPLRRIAAPGATLGRSR